MWIDSQVGVEKFTTRSLLPSLAQPTQTQPMLIPIIIEDGNQKEEIRK